MQSKWLNLLGKCLGVCGILCAASASMESMMKKVLVLGGTGFIGQQVCEKLAAAGHAITVATRSPAYAKGVQVLPRVTVLPCNVHSAAQLARAMAGHDVLINLIAVLHGDAQRFEQVHVTLPSNIAAACGAAGVRRVLHVSAQGAAPDAPSEYLQSKARGEAAWQACAAQGVHVTLLRPSIVFGEQDKLLNVFAKLQKLFPVMPLAGADCKFQPVWVQDVAQALVNLLAQPQPQSHEVGIYEASGKDILTLRELVNLAGRCAGVQRPVLSLPGFAAQLQAWVMAHLPGEPLMSRDNLKSLLVDNVASGKHPGLDALGIRAASIYAIAPLYLGSAKNQR
jgi:uncharacterized protein YbjT (DUF2867 family)